MMGKSDAWMPFYVADYIADTVHLNTEQHGAYFLLILAAWKRGGRLPDDDNQLAAVCRLTLRAWKSHGVILRQFFEKDGDFLVHRRVEREVLRTSELTEKRRAAGKLGGRPAKPNGKANGKHNETHARVALPLPLQKELLPTSVDEETQQNGQAVRKTGCRIPDGFPTGAEVLHAVGQGMSRERADTVAQDFRDFWLAKSGPDARKIDWPATWRRWVRKDLEYRKPKSQPQGRVPWV